MITTFIHFLDEREDAFEIKLPLIPNNGESLLIDDEEYIVMERIFTINGSNKFHASLTVSKKV